MLTVFNCSWKYLCFYILLFIVSFIFYPVAAVWSACCATLYFVDGMERSKIFLFSFGYALLSLGIEPISYPLADINTYYNFISSDPSLSLKGMKVQRYFFSVLYNEFYFPLNLYGFYNTFILSFVSLMCILRCFLALDVTYPFAWFAVFLTLLSPHDLLAYEYLTSYSLVFLSYCFFYERKYILMSFGFIFALTFHFSSVIFVAPILISFVFTSYRVICILYAVVIMFFYIYFKFIDVSTGVGFVDSILSKMHSYLFGPWSRYVRIYEYILLFTNMLKVLTLLYCVFLLRGIVESRIVRVVFTLCLTLAISLPFSALSFRVSYSWLILLPFVFYVLQNFKLFIYFRLFLIVTIFLTPLPRFMEYYKFMPDVIEGNMLKGNIFDTFANSDFIFNNNINSSGRNRE